MDDAGRKIEIIKPFNDAFELMKVILFRPFDLSKWCVLGFAAFLSNLAGGGFNFNFDLGRWGRSHSEDSFLSAHEISSWILPLIVIGAAVGIALVLLCLWVGSRGRFIFVDCIAQNRAAIAVPWREYRKEGNSLFLFSLAALAILLVAAAIAAAPVVLLWLGHEASGPPISAIVTLLIVAPILFILILAWAVIREFMVPVMYRQRCPATAAFQKVTSLLAAYPGEIVLFVLFCIALALGTVFVVIAAMCATCCVVLIPYVGTVILLPVFVLFRGYMLLFLRQFGSEYDAWGDSSPLPAAPPSLPA